MVFTELYRQEHLNIPPYINLKNDSFLFVLAWLIVESRSRWERECSIQLFRNWEHLTRARQAPKANSSNISVSHRRSRPPRRCEIKLASYPEENALKSQCIYLSYFFPRHFTIWSASSHIELEVWLEDLVSIWSSHARVRHYSFHYTISGPLPQACLFLISFSMDSNKLEIYFS